MYNKILYSALILSIAASITGCGKLSNPETTSSNSAASSVTDSKETERAAETEIKETEKPAETEIKETEKPAETEIKETEKPAETEKPVETEIKETEKPVETEAVKETESAEDVNPEETVKITDSEAAEFQKSFKEASIAECKSVFDSINNGIILNREKETEHMITRQAALLMNWSLGTTLTNDEVKDIYNDYISDFSKGDIQSMRFLFNLVYDEYKVLLTPGQEQRIADAECDVAYYPNTEPIELIEYLKELIG